MIWNYITLHYIWVNVKSSWNVGIWLWHRTKLKQTEVDCEYLKRCCETLTDENRRLQKELQELRALKTSQPFFMQLPATTLTMCPSCERVAPTSTSAVTVAASSSSPATPSASVKPATPKRPSPETTNGDITLSLGKPQPQPQPASWSRYFNLYFLSLGPFRRNNFNGTLEMGQREYILCFF